MQDLNGKSNMYMSNKVINEVTDDDKRFEVSPLVCPVQNGCVISNFVIGKVEQRHQFLQSPDFHHYTEMAVISQIRSDYNNRLPFQHVFTIEKSVSKAIWTLLQDRWESKEHFQKSRSFRIFYQDISVGYVTSTGQLKSTAYMFVNNSIVEALDYQKVLLQFKKLQLKITSFFMRNDELKSDTIMKSRGMKSAFIRTGKFVNEYIEIHNPLEGELKAGTTIHVVYRPIDDQIYAVKKSLLASPVITFQDVFWTLHQHTQDHRKIREAKILARLRHPNVLRLFDWWIEEEKNGLYALYLQLEYCSFPGFKHQTNDLLMFAYYYLNPMDNRKKLEHIKLIMGQIVDGLEYIHKNGIMHRDLKPENIFVSITVSGELQVMLGDFDQGKDVREVVPSNINKEQVNETELNELSLRNSLETGTNGYALTNKDKVYDQFDEFFALGITLLHLCLTFPGEPKNRNHYAWTFGMSEIPDVLPLFDTWSNQFVKNKHQEFNFQYFVPQLDLAKKLLDKRVNTHSQLRSIIQSW